MPTDCPPDSRFNALLDGGLTAEDAAELDTHLAACTDCQTRLDHLSNSPRLESWRAAAGPTDLAPPQFPGDLGTLGRFPVEAELGRGGMGVVYRGRDPDLHRPVALKVLRSDSRDPAAAARFDREARAAAQVRHDNLVPVLNVERTADGRVVLVMPVIEGPSLRGRLRAEGALPPRDAADIVKQIADGLAAAHAAGVVHRDVKPANVLLDSTDGRAKLTDFGLARAFAAGETLTQADVLAGTPEYLAPELAANPAAADPRSDIYSLGVTLYECLTGVVPFRGSPLDVLQRHRVEEPVSPRRLNAAVPRDLETVCRKCLEKSPARRYTTAGEVREELGRFLEGRPILARPVGPLGRGRRWAKRNPLAVAVVLVSLIGAAASAAGWYSASQNATDARNRERDADTARGVAVEKGALADDRAAVALAAVDALIGKAQSLADSTPGTLKLKRELNETALAELKKLTATADRIAGVDLVTVRAHLKLGDTLNQLGRTDEAVAAWSKGKAAAEELLAADPGGAAARREIARADAALGFTRMRLNDTAAALGHYEAAIAALEALHAADPADRVTAYMLASALNGRADVRRAALDGPGAYADSERSLGLFDRLLAADPADGRAASAVYYTRSRLGYTAMYADKDAAAGRRHFVAGLNQARREYARRADEPVWRRNFAVALLDLASAEQRLGHFDAADKLLDEADPIVDAAHAAAPDDAMAGRDVGIARLHRAWVRLGLGDFAAAEALLLKAEAALAAVATKATNSATVANDRPAVKYLLATVYGRLGQYDRAAAAVGEWRTLFVASLPANTPAAAVAAFNARVAETQAAVRLVEKSLSDPSVIAAQPRGVAGPLSRFRGMALMARGNADLARTELRALRDRDPTDALTHETLALVCGHLAAAAKAQADRDRFLQECEVALLAAIRLDRATVDAIHFAPELNAVRYRPGFQEKLRAALAGR